MNTMIEDKIAFYKKDIDNPFSVNGFKGTWQISDHALIPDVLHNFICRWFGVGRIKRAPLKEINTLMNDVWEGPGSLEKIFRLEREMELSGKTIKLDPRDYVKKGKDKEEEFEFEEIDLPLNSFSDSFDLNEDED